MGLKKTKEVDNLGVNGDYWRNIQLNINFDSNDAVCTLQQYVSQVGRESGNNPLPQSVAKPLEGNFLDREVTLDGGEVISMRDLILREVYGAWNTIAVAEQAKIDADEKGNADVAFFADASNV